LQCVDLGIILHHENAHIVYVWLCTYWHIAYHLKFFRYEIFIYISQLILNVWNRELFYIMKMHIFCVKLYGILGHLVFSHWYSGNTPLLV
jgi:hypothetical protein